MSWQLNHVVTQPQSDSIITFFLGETALSRAGLCCVYNNQYNCNKQYQRQRKTNKRVSFEHHLYSNNTASFSNFYSQIITPVLWGLDFQIDVEAYLSSTETNNHCLLSFHFRLRLGSPLLAPSSHRSLFNYPHSPRISMRAPVSAEPPDRPG